MASRALATAFVNIVPGTKDLEDYLKGKLKDDAQKSGDESGSGWGERFGKAVKTALAVAAVTAVAATLKNAIDDSMKAFEDWAGSVRGLGRVTGGTVEEASSLAGAFKLVGIDAENTTATFRIFSKHLQDANGDQQKTAELNAKLGGSFLDANGKMKSMSDLLPMVADKFKSMPDGIEKTALATELFGRSGTQMLPFLNKGSAGIEELTKKAKDMGLVLDDQAMNTFVEHKKAQREWDATMQGLQVTVGSALTPVMEILGRTIREQVMPWIQKASQFVKDHRAEFEDLAAKIKAIVKPALELVAGVFRDVVVPAIKGVIDMLAGLPAWFEQNKGWAVPLLVALGLIALGVTGVGIAMQIAAAGGLAAFVAGMWPAVTAAWAFTTALLANPITWVVVGIALLIAAIVALVMNWDAIVKWIGDVWNGFMGWLSDSFNSIATWWNDLWTGVGKFVSDVWNGIVSWVSGVVSGFLGWFRDNWMMILGFLTGPFGLAIAWIVKNWDGIVKFFSDSLGKIGGFFTTVFKGIGDTVRGVFEGIVSFIKGAINSVIDIVNGAIDGINSVGDAIRTATGGAVDINVGHVPRLAKGGFVDQPTTALIGEAGPEVVTPLKDFERMMGLDGNGKGNTVNYYAAPNQSIDAEQALFTALKRAKVLAAW